MRTSGSCTSWFILRFIFVFNALRVNERNETLCVNHLGKCQMNTFWWWRWKCVYTNIISTTSLILNGPRDEAIRHTYAHTYTHTQRDTNCVHWAKSEINQPAPEEWIIYVCQRSFNSAIGTNQTSQYFSREESSLVFVFCLLYLHQMTFFGTDWISNWNQERNKTHTHAHAHMDHPIFVIPPISANHERWRLAHRLRRSCF